MRRERAVGIALLLCALVVDQAVKASVLASPFLDASRGIEVLPFLNIVLVKNTGVSFGLLSTYGIPWWVFALFSLAIVAWLATWLWQSGSMLLSAGLGLIVGGAMSNIVDRFRHGGVTDFIDFHVAGWHWPAFNTADAAITIGVLAILLVTMMRPKSQPSQAASGGGYTPALGRLGWASEYDRIIRIWTREDRWRPLLIKMIALKPGERLLDVGCGTGTLTVMLKDRTAGAMVAGLDPDPEILNIAAEKARVWNVQVDWIEGFARDASRLAGAATYDVVSSSLMFHQVPMEEKRAALLAMREALAQCTAVRQDAGSGQASAEIADSGGIKSDHDPHQCNLTAPGLSTMRILASKEERNDEE